MAVPASAQSSTSRLLRWRNFHRGQECLLICNGPSLNEIDWNAIRPDLVKFGLNKIHLGRERFGFEPRFLCCVNALVLEQSRDAFVHSTAVRFVSDRLPESEYQENPLQYRIRTQNLPAGARRFSEDITQYVEEGWTVTFAALQIIYYMGFSRVYIVGMDHRFKQNVEGSENVEVTMTGDDKDHFDPRYFGGGQRWQIPDLARSEESYQVAREVFERDGRRIYDCTIEGACDVFEKQDVQVLYSPHEQA